MTKGQKLIQFLIKIIADPTIPPDQLKKRLNLSKDQYYRYFNELCSCRYVPLRYDDQAKRYVFEGDGPDKEIYGDPEMFKLFLILLHSLTVRYDINQSAARTRLFRLLDLEDRVETMSRAIEERGHGDADGALRKWALRMIEAIANEKSLEITYEREKGSCFTLIIDPLKLIHDGEWYLHALYLPKEHKAPISATDKREQRYYKVQRIKEMKETNNKYRKPPKLEIVQLSMPWDFCDDPNGLPERVTVKLSPVVSRYIREKKTHPTMELHELNSGGVEMTVHVKAPEKMLPWILSFGTEAEVLEPDHLRDLVKIKAQELAALYP